MKNKSNRNKAFISILMVTGFILSLHLSAQDTPVWFEELMEMPVAKLAPGSAVLDGKIYVAGGANDLNTNAYASVDVYDPETDSWSGAPQSMLYTRMAFSMHAINGKLFAISGTTTWYAEIGLKENEVYDPETNSWKSNMCDIPDWRESYLSCVLNNKIYVLGGIGSELNGDNNIANSNFVYDPATNTWDTIRSMNYKRQGGHACTVNNKIYVFGGFKGQLEVEQRPEVYNVLTDTWEVLDSMPYMSTSGKSFLFEDHIYLIGDYTPEDWIGDAWQTIWKYNPEDDSWQRMENIPAFFPQSAIQKIGDYIYVFGGMIDQDPGNFDFIAIKDAFRINLPLVEEYIPASVKENIDLQSVLFEAYPNPLNMFTKIKYELNEPTHVQLKIFNCIGKEVAVLVNENKSPGNYEITWNAEGIHPGIYFCRLHANGYAQTQKLIVSQ